MDRLIRFAALAAAGTTLVWLSGCPAVDTQAVKQQQQQAAEQEAAREEAQRNEAPSVITPEDFRRGDKLEGGGYVSTSVRAGLVGGEKVTLGNVQHQMRIHAAANEWPESHEEYMEIIDGWGMTLPELEEPYEYWYNAEDHQLYKRPKPEAAADVSEDTTPSDE